MERVGQLQLANLQQELLAPALAIRTYAEKLAAEARQEKRTAQLADLEIMRDAGRELYELVRSLVSTNEPSAMRDLESRGDTWKQQLRHALRTPITTLKGYAELVAGEWQQSDGVGPVADLDCLMIETSRLFTHLDLIVDFHMTSAMSAQLLRSMTATNGTHAPCPASADILVVDDIASSRDLLARQLRQDGHRVETAEDGRQALVYLRERGVDIVLLDLLMPEQNGFDVLSAIKADTGLCDMAVIVVSGLDDRDSVIRCIDAGAEDYLPKPYDRYLLRARINAILRRKMRPAPTAETMVAGGTATGAATARRDQKVREENLRHEIERVLEVSADMLARNRYLTSRSLARLLARSGEHRFKEPTLRKIIDRRYPPMRRLGLTA